MGQLVKKALVLAAGSGSRLRPLTDHCPKPLLPLGGKPVLEYAITWLRYHGITQIAVNLHHKPQPLIDYFGSGQQLGVEIIYSVEDQALGSAGGARRLRGFWEGTFVVAYGDVITNLNLTELLRFHLALTVPANGLATLALNRVANPWECGIVALDATNRVRCFVEKPGPVHNIGNLANAGVLVLEPAALDLVPPERYFDFGTDLFPLMLKQDIPLFGWQIGADDYVLDMGTLERYRQAEKDIRAGRWRLSPTTTS